MKIKSVRIENFRAFKGETVKFNDYSCFVGPNGAGKSVILAAIVKGGQIYFPIFSGD